MNPDFAPIFEPYYVEKLSKMRKTDVQFSHYTSAHVAVSVIRNKEIWLRNASVMNDYNEIRYGIGFAAAALGTGGDPRFIKLLNDIDSNTPYGNRFHFTPTLPHDVHLLCLSEHGPENGPEGERDLGRLSMWRAYGGNTNVAIVFKREELLNALGNTAILKPVFYADERRFLEEFSNMLDAVSANIDILKEHPNDATHALRSALDVATLSTKHPGFAEEMEWRVIYRNDSAGDKMPCEVFSVGDVPQKVHLLRLDGSSKPDMNEVLDHILIGPTQFPEVIRSSLAEALRLSGFSEPETRVKVSHIPLRR
ncbi:DUF2971 domain-containing protein [Cereibacter sphaeroides]|nr:DUF2971 domain-containing protein [Cereibacter sphaeroides]